MSFMMVDGSGDPNNNPEFENAVELLYGLSYAIKMSKMKAERPEGYFDYVVPPLEGLWWIEGGTFCLERRENWKWTVMIRQPEFVTEETFNWACDSLRIKKPELDISKAYYKTFQEGLCVQIMHTGLFSTEPESVKKLEGFISDNNLVSRLGSGGKHHEIYLSDPRKSKQESMKTVLRHPVEQKGVAR